jgi:acetylornithine/succinyldiaminopimelate/putrescine aminotransferase
VAAAARDLLDAPAGTTQAEALLAEKLCAATGMSAAVLLSSPSEAVEAALRLARRFMRFCRGEDRYAFVVSDGSMRGHTLGALSASGLAEAQVGYEPMAPGFCAAAMGDTRSLVSAIDRTTAAVIVEPVQIEAGLRVVPVSFISDARAACFREGALLIADESGLAPGQAGAFPAVDAGTARPDMLVLGSGMAGGLPMGAVLCTAEVASALGPGVPGGDQTGLCLKATAALATLEAVLAGELPAHAALVGAYMAERVQDLARRRPVISAVRGAGLMAAADLAIPAAPFAAACRGQGLLVGLCGDSAILLAPPLIVQRGHVRAAVEILDQCLA